MTIPMDAGAAELLHALHGGHAAYVVGGCVRDSLLGLTPPHDWDLCTSALPQQVMELVRGRAVHPHRPAARHGNGEAGGASCTRPPPSAPRAAIPDGRHPDAVRFVPDVKEDLARRDFTINAMAYNEKPRDW